VTFEINSTRSGEEMQIVIIINNAPILLQLNFSTANRQVSLHNSVHRSWRIVCFCSLQWLDGLLHVTYNIGSAQVTNH